MTTYIDRMENGVISVRCPDLSVYITPDETDFNRHHEGVWDSRVLAFVPQQEEDLTKLSLAELSARIENRSLLRHERLVQIWGDGYFTVDDTTFSDGTPVSSYEQLN